MNDWIGKPVSALPTPALIIDRPQLEANINRMADWARTQGIALRPHAKSHKSPDIARRQIDAGAVGVCCATVLEAETLVAAGIPSVLLTTAAGPNMAARIAGLAKTSSGFASVVDSSEQLAGLKSALDAVDATLPVFIDLDVGLGRTGVPSTERVAKLAEEIQDSNRLRFEGVQAYMGHVQHINDWPARQKQIGSDGATLASFRDALSAINLAPGVVSGGGTGSHRIDAANGNISELQAGSYIFMDRQYLDVDLNGDKEQLFPPSLFIDTTVINAQHAGFAITDAGLKSFATDDDVPLVFQPDGLTYSFKGDEHGKVSWQDDAAALSYGDRVRCIVPHCDPTVNLYDEYYVIENEVIVEVWPIAARGHR